VLCWIVALRMRRKRRLVLCRRRCRVLLVVTFDPGSFRSADDGPVLAGSWSRRTFADAGCVPVVVAVVAAAAVAAVA